MNSTCRLYIEYGKFEGGVAVVVERSKSVVSRAGIILGRGVRTVLVLGFGVAATALVSLLLSIVASRRPGSRWIDTILQWWGRAWLWPAGIEIRVHGAHNVDPDGVYVVVSNHLSNLDTMVHFVSLPVPLRFLAKKELYRLPLLRSAMRAGGMIKVDRDAADLDQLNLEAGERLAAGKSVIVYPEGTRSRGGNIGEFKIGAFAIAAANGVPVLPVTIHGTREVWPPQSKLIHGGTVDIVIGLPIPDGNTGTVDAGHLRDEAYQVIRRNYLALRVYNHSQEEVGLL